MIQFSLKSFGIIVTVVCFAVGVMFAVSSRRASVNSMIAAGKFVLSLNDDTQIMNQKIEAFCEGDDVYSRKAVMSFNFLADNQVKYVLAGIGERSGKWEALRSAPFRVQNDRPERYLVILSPDSFSDQDTKNLINFEILPP